VDEVAPVETEPPSTLLCKVCGDRIDDAPWLERPRHAHAVRRVPNRIPVGSFLQDVFPD
jgi:hypothetical protein